MPRFALWFIPVFVVVLGVVALAWWLGREPPEPPPPEPLAGELGDTGYSRAMVEHQMRIIGYVQ